MIKLIYSSFFMACIFLSSFLWAEGNNFIATNNARVQLLNKVTGKTMQVTISKNKAYRFDQNLQVILRQCYKSAENDKRENEAFLQVVRLVYEKENDTVFSSFNEKIPMPKEIIPPSSAGSVNHIIFSGWMFSSSPSISLLEDKIYSVSLLQCK
ncbi:DUF2155 domain-containing protein [Candidatus Hepatincola sp. Av]